MSEPLTTYLQDHLSGARIAIELLQAMRDRHHSQPFGEFIAHLLTAIEADRDSLHQLVEKIGRGSDVLKEISGWVGEKATRVKLGQTPGDEFSTFQTLEFLALGILGKVALWKALNVAVAADERLHGFDFNHLATRAEIQYADVEHQRLEFAKTALRRAH